MKTHAILVGVNAYSSPLAGAINDAFAMKVALEPIVGASLPVLADASRKDIVSTLDDVIGNAETGDHVLFFFAGHGTQIMQWGTGNRGEPDGLNEALCPVDFDVDTSENAILDVDVHGLLSKREGIDLTIIIDCCHSGGIATVDIMRARKNDGSLVPSESDSVVPVLAEPRIRTLSRFSLADRSRMREMRVSTFARPSGRLTGKNVVVLTACGALEFAREIRERHRWHGVFTHFLARELSANPRRSIRELRDSVAEHIRLKQIAQTPGLETANDSKPMVVHAGI